MLSQSSRSAASATWQASLELTQTLTSPPAGFHERGSLAETLGQRIPQQAQRGPQQGQQQERGDQQVRAGD